MDDDIKCERIDGRSARHLNTFSNLFTTGIVDCTHVHHVLHKKYQHIH